MKKLKMTKTFLLIILSTTFANAQSITCNDFSILGYEPELPGHSILHIRLEGDSMDFISYPYISFVTDCNGDTIATGSPSFFGQMGQTVQSYPVTGDITNTCLPINVEFVFGNTNFETDTCILTLNSLQAPLSCSDFIPLGIHADQFNTLINISMAGTGNSFISNPLISIVTDCVGDTIATGFINSSGQLGLSVQGYPITPLANTVCYPITVQFSYGNTNFEIDTCFLTLDAITGIPESFNVESEISIFPNPSSNEITIQSKKSIHGNSYFIYDYQGNLILIGKLISENTFVDISKLSNGMYFLKIDNYLGEIYKVLKQ